MILKNKNISTQPGVYRMINQEGQVIYVGKAKNLKNRINQYFHKQLSSKTQSMMQQVVRIETTITHQENEALLLEANLIKELKPRYNILLRDDKSYPYLYLNVTHPFPQLDFYRGDRKKPGRYFGPYPSAGSVRDNLSLIQKLFKLRQCSDIFFSNRTRPCLQYQIKRCTAPCVGYVNEEKYHKQVEDAVLFLEGKNSEITVRLAARMEEASAALDYEQAAHYRDQIIQLRKLQQQQIISSQDGNIDVIGIAEGHGLLAIVFLYIRAGRMLGTKPFFVNIPKDRTASEALNEFIPQYYLSDLHKEDIPDVILATMRIQERAWIESALSELTKRQLLVVDVLRKPYVQWQQMAKINAEQALSQQLSEKNTIASRLTELQHALPFSNMISRIECFDVSHTMGEATIASCVVFGTEGFIKKDYRRFSITDITPGDDYAALKQAIKRRYLRIKESNQVFPDLLIIDGGLGQLKQAAIILEELQISGVVIMGVAKGPSRKPGLEKIWINGRAEPISFAPDHAALHLIQQIRDEAHRFAITAHRAARHKKRVESPLQQIPGIGPKRRRDLLNYFGGFQSLEQASIDEISRVPGISRQLATIIYQALHK